MTDVNAVCSLFRERYGDAAPENDVKAICFTAVREIGPLLKEGCENDIRVLGAAAAKANLRLWSKALYSDEQVCSFRAGDIALTFSPRAAYNMAESEYNQAISALAPLLRDDGFSFRQVKI
jgi:hypothetical protein